MSDALYESDFYAWTQDQADALRHRRAQSNAVDWERVAEEIADLGASEKNTVRSSVLRILEHLYKLSATANADVVPHWAAEIGNFRAEMFSRLTPTIARLVKEELPQLHARAARQAQKQFRLQEPQSVIDPSLRWTWDQITGDGEEDPLDRDYPIARD